MDTTFAVTFFSALFAIMNPFLTLPIFLSMTAGQTVQKQRTTAIQIVFYSGIMCAIIAFAGNQILSFFGISIDHFRVAGGMVLLGIAFSMLNGKESTSHTGAEKEKEHLNNIENIAFYPMTFPMIVGPGTITTLVLYIHHANQASQYMAYGAALLAVLAIMFGVLFFAAAIGHVLSGKIRVIITRIMGMLLSAIAISMIVAGLKILLPGLAGS